MTRLQIILNKNEQVHIKYSFIFIQCTLQKRTLTRHHFPLTAIKLKIYAQKCTAEYFLYKHSFYIKKLFSIYGNN